MCVKVVGDVDKVLYGVEGRVTGIWLSSGGGSRGGLLWNEWELGRRGVEAICTILPKDGISRVSNRSHTHLLADKISHDTSRPFP